MNRRITTQDISWFLDLNANEQLDLEQRKIKCGEAHFSKFKDVEYRQVAKVSDLDSKIHAQLTDAGKTLGI